MIPVARPLETIAAIAGMAVVTYCTRAAGLAVMSRLSLSGRAERFMKAIPGAILTSIIAPQALAAGPAEAAATLVTGVAAWKFRNLPLAMIAGVATVLGLRLLMR